jgi:hypothetical protein
MGEKRHDQPFPHFSSLKRHLQLSGVKQFITHLSEITHLELPIMTGVPEYQCVPASQPMM